VSKCLPSSWRWKDSLLELNIVNAQLGLNKVSASGLSRIQNESFAEYSPKSRGDNFARCGQCNKLKKLWAACTRGSRAAVLWTKKLEAHGQAQRAHKELYYANRNLSKSEPNIVLTIIHDKMDHSKTTCPQFSHKNKAVDSFIKLPVAVTGMIAYGHGDVRYAHYGLDINPSDSNHTIGSIAKLLRDLELLQCIQLGRCLLEVAHLLCFRSCSLGLLCVRGHFLLHQKVQLKRLPFRQFSISSWKCMFRQ
jgi:hypothetical protein